MVHREPFAGAAESGHHFVGDQQDAVLVAELPQPLQITVRWHEDPVSTGNRFQNNCRDGLRAFEFEDLLGARQHLFGRI